MLFHTYSVAKRQNVGENYSTKPLESKETRTIWIPAYAGMTDGFLLFLFVSVNISGVFLFVYLYRFVVRIICISTKQSSPTAYGSSQYR